MTEFERLMEHRDLDYKYGYYESSNDWATKAIGAARDKEEIALAVVKRGWGERFRGFKIDDPDERKKMYLAAKHDWLFVLEDEPKDIDVMISAIKGLMLLPGEDVYELYELGEREIAKRVTDSQERKNLEGELGNSQGIQVRAKYPKTAMQIFLYHYKEVTPGTVVAGHLIKNLAVCCLMLKNSELDKQEKAEYANVAIGYLRKSLKEYPLEQIEHRRDAQAKIDNTIEEIKNNFE